MSNKKVHQFTLVLANVDENTFGLEDSLYKAGCDDALINFRNGTVYLGFDRTASSLERAVFSAIKDIESSSIGAKVVNIAPDILVTESEIAARVNFKRQAVSLWIMGKRRKSNPFPKPVMKLSQSSPLWRWTDVVEWLFENKIILDKEIIQNAHFFEAMATVLEERVNKVSLDRRQRLLARLESR